MRLAELGERGFVEVVLKKLRESGVEAGDDAAFIDVAGVKLAVACDMLVWSTDVPPGMKHRDVGWKAAVACISDLAAKGARPVALLASLGLTTSMEVDEALELIEGVRMGAVEHGAAFVGGDTNEACEVVIDVAGLGLLKHPPIKRSGARPGDYVAVTGPFGSTGAAFHMALRGLKPRDEELRSRLWEALRRPRARLKEGLALASSRSASASIDSSDGLALSLHQLAEASGVGIRVDHVPVSEEARAFAEEFSLNPLDLALYGGEEYELVVAIPSEKWRDAVAAVEGAGGALLKIGVATSGEGVKLCLKERSGELPRRGWEHLKPRR